MRQGCLYQPCAFFFKYCVSISKPYVVHDCGIHSITETLELKGTKAYRQRASQGLSLIINPAPSTDFCFPASGSGDIKKLPSTSSCRGFFLVSGAKILVTPLCAADFCSIFRSAFSGFLNGTERSRGFSNSLRLNGLIIIGNIGICFFGCCLFCFLRDCFDRFRTIFCFYLFCFQQLSGIFFSLDWLEFSFCFCVSSVDMSL